MTEREHHDDTVIDLGQASIETKGQLQIQNDPGGGQLASVFGAIED